MLHKCFATQNQYIPNLMLVFLNNQENEEDFWKIRWVDLWTVIDTAGTDWSFYLMSITSLLSTMNAIERSYQNILELRWVGTLALLLCLASWLCFLISVVIVGELAWVWNQWWQFPFIFKQDLRTLWKNKHVPTLQWSRKGPWELPETIPCMLRWQHSTLASCIISWTLTHGQRVRVMYEFAVDSNWANSAEVCLNTSLWVTSLKNHLATSCLPLAPCCCQEAMHSTWNYDQNENIFSWIIFKDGF